MLTALPKPAPPLRVGQFPANAVADTYEIVPCTVNPRRVRLILFDGRRISFTRTVGTVDDAQAFAHEFVFNAAFRQSVQAEARAHMEMY